MIVQADPRLYLGVDYPESLTWKDYTNIDLEKCHLVMTPHLTFVNDMLQ